MGKKIVNKTIDLPVSQRVQGQLNAEKMQVATNEEMEMSKQDKNEADRLNAKNSVEEYIYEIRGKLCEELEDFMLEEDRNKFSLELEDAENWLYEDGEYAEKSEYNQKLSQLKTKRNTKLKRKFQLKWKLIRKRMGRRKKRKIKRRRQVQKNPRRKKARWKPKKQKKKSPRKM